MNPIDQLEHVIAILATRNRSFTSGESFVGADDSSTITNSLSADIYDFSLVLPLWIFKTLPIVVRPESNESCLIKIE